MLAQSAPAEFFASLGGLSAASRLINAGTRVQLDFAASVVFPRPTAPAAGDLPWVGEGNPIPVRQLAFEACTLGPVKKLAIITALTGEVAATSAAETVITALLRESAALSLDAAMFSAIAASASAPAGLLNGVSALTASTGPVIETAMMADLAALAAAVTSAGGSAESLVIVAAAPQAAQILIRLPDLRVPVWSSRALADGVVIALDGAGFASAFDTTVEIRASRDAAVHHEDTAPLPLGAAGPILASPIRSYFQTDTIGLRLVARAAFVMRAPLVAHITDVIW